MHRHGTEQSLAHLRHSQAPGFCCFFLHGALHPLPPGPAGGTKKGAGWQPHAVVCMIVLIPSFKTKLHLPF